MITQEELEKDWGNLLLFSFTNYDEIEIKLKSPTFITIEELNQLINQIGKENIQSIRFYQSLINILLKNEVVKK